MIQNTEEIKQGENYLINGQIDKAIGIFDSILEKDPDNDSALNNKGVAFNRLEKMEDAIVFFIAALEKNRNNANAAFNLIANYMTLNRYQEAFKALENFRHCLNEDDIEMIEIDIQKLRSRDQYKPNQNDNIIVSFNMNSENYQHKLKLSLDLNKFSQKIIWNFLSKDKIYEPGTCNFIDNILKDGDYVIDIGAHIGFFSILTSKIVGQNGKIYSFEPETTNYENLKNNINLNKLTNIKTFNMALSSKDSAGELFINSDNDGGHALWDVSRHSFNKKTRKDNIKQPVKISTLDTIFEDQDLKNIKLIKIDTEGTEREIILGAQKTIAKYNIPFIICEINRFGLKNMNTDESELRAFMQGLGYETYLIEDDKSELRHLDPEQKIVSSYVFNVVFINSEGEKECGF